MAERRMFAKSIVTSDAFLDMPMSARCLYFTLGMFADDDGFVNSPKSIMRQVGATQDDMQILIAKKFVLLFNSGVIAIKHWRINNYLRADRYRETNYIDEKSELQVDSNGAYTMDTTGIPGGIPMVYKRETQDRIGKDSIGKNNTSSSPAANVDSSPSLSDEFEELWKLYPRKAGKKKAFESYKRSRKNGATFDQVKDGIQGYVESIKRNGTPKQYVLMGQTFFNQERWSDEFIIEEKPKSNVIEPPKYKKFEPEPEKERVEMPDEIRARLKTMF